MLDRAVDNWLSLKNEQIVKNSKYQFVLKNIKLISELMNLGFSVNQIYDRSKNEMDMSRSTFRIYVYRAKNESSKEVTKEVSE